MDVWYHTDGQVRDILADLIEIGVQVINCQVPVVGHEWIARNFRGRVAFRTDIDRQRIMPFGSPFGSQGRSSSNLRGVRLFAGRHRGLRRNRPRCSLENILAMYEAFREFGTYPFELESVAPCHPSRPEILCSAGGRCVHDLTELYVDYAPGILILLCLCILFSSLVCTAGQPPRKVWQVGTFDESSHEFKEEGIDYANPAEDPVFWWAKVTLRRTGMRYQPGSGNGKTGFRPHPSPSNSSLATEPKVCFLLKVGLLTYMAAHASVQIDINGIAACSTYVRSSTTQVETPYSVFLPTYSYGRLSRNCLPSFCVKGKNSLALTAMDEPGQRDNSQSHGREFRPAYDALELENDPAAKYAAIGSQPMWFRRFSTSRTMDGCGIDRRISACRRRPASKGK